MVERIYVSPDLNDLGATAFTVTPSPELAMVLAEDGSNIISAARSVSDGIGWQCTNRATELGLRPRTEDAPGCGLRAEESVIVGAVVIACVSNECFGPQTIHSRTAASLATQLSLDYLEGNYGETEPINLHAGGEVE